MTGRQPRAVPDHFGNYEIQDELGRGGMATVFTGHDRFRDRLVAIKVADTQAIRDTQKRLIFEKLFFNEAHSAGMLQHPNIVEIFDAGQEDGFFYIAMEFVPNGRTLSRHCSGREMLPIERVIEIAFKCAQALDYAHRRGVIHRDIKPENILLGAAGGVKVSDFSIALTHNEAIMETQIMLPVGSPLYMSPEQLSDMPLTHKTDLFSLGVVIYQMLCGRHPFITDNLAVLTHKIINEPAPDIPECRPDAPGVLVDIIDKCLRKAPDDRYSTAWDLAADLSQLPVSSQLYASIPDGQGRLDILKSIKFFVDFGDAEIWELLRRGRWHDKSNGDLIIREGERDDSVYIIVKGEVAVLKGDRELTTLGAGEIFGEIGYLAKVRRSASIRAKGDISLMEFNAELLDHASSQTQINFQRVFIGTLIQRLISTTEMLAGKNGEQD